MKPIFILFCLILLPAGSIFGQTKYKWFFSIAASQNSNYFIYKSSNHQVFISSFDGLNIYDGQEIKTYRALTHHMKGSAMTSTFFEDTSGLVWFTTTEALHVYNPKTDSLDYTQMISSTGEVLSIDHSAFHLSGNILYLRAKEEVFSYDVINRCVSEIYQIDFSPFAFFTFIEASGKTQFFCAGNDGYAAYGLEQNQKVDSLYFVAKGHSAACVTPSKQIWLGGYDGKLLQVDPLTGKIIIESQLAETGINGILPVSDNKLLVTVTHNQVLEFDVPNKKVVDRYIPQLAGTREFVSHLMIPYLDKDSTLWIGGASQGLVFRNLRKQKFQHYLNIGADQKQIIVTRILPVQTNNYLIFTRRYGILLINEKGDILYHWRQLPEGIMDFTSTCATRVNERKFLFNHNDKLYQLDLQRKKIERLYPGPGCTPLNFQQFETLPNGKIIASCLYSLIIELQIMNGKYFCKPYADLQKHTDETYSFKSDLAGNLYVGGADDAVLVLAQNLEGNDHTFSHELPLRGGINSLLELKDNSGMYFTNTNGLFYMPSGTRNITQIRDKEDLLSQTIYAAMEDAKGHLWLSSNTGILKYNPADHSVKKYSSLDGVQAAEFNTHAYLETPDGHILFGGINGLNYFHPADIISSERNTPVYIRSVKINDEIDSSFLVPQFQDSFILPYARNTISFDFHAIDYADPDATRTKYKLDGVDDDYILSQTAKGFARYANLPHGHYTLLILGANSDGHWNEVPRAITIIIEPPFYLTWWFMALCVLSFTALIYFLVQIYFRQKLERNKQMLREQALIIEKQRAIEYERNRIASEMHDDLGSGLTTIRYLSDRALQQAKNAQEVTHIKRISEHSDQLVRNMSEIIWAMNSRFDNAESLNGYLRRYASEFLDEHQIPLRFSAGEDHLDKIIISGEKRRNVFLIFKEILHNAVKYSGAERIDINIQTDQKLQIHIAEIGGIGFELQTSTEKGNGLFNCQKRIKAAGGQLIFEKTSEAMHIDISIPLNPDHGE